MKKQEQTEEPTLAEGIDTEDIMQQDATSEEIAKGEYTTVFRTAKEELEISSTGYGYESVTNEKGNHESLADQQLDSFSEGY